LLFSSVFSAKGFLIATGLLDPLERGVLLPGFVGVLVGGAGFFVTGVVLDGVGLEGVVFDGADLAVVVVGLVCAFVAVVLDDGVLGEGLDKGVLVVAVFDVISGVFDVPFVADAA